MKICIVDDHNLFSEGLRDILKMNNDDYVIDTYHDSLKAFQSILDKNYQLILSDINMVPINGFELVEMVKKVKPNLPIILISVRADSFTIEKAREMNANGFMSKNDSKENFMDAINCVTNGQHYFKNKENSSKGYHFSDGKIVKLTKREMDVLQLLCNQLATKEIAHKLKISEYTVTGYRKSLFQKFEVRNMIGLVKYAYEIGLF